MKTMKTNKFWMCALAMTAFLMGACIEENEAPTPIFPTEVTTHTVAAGEEVTIAFTANTDWQLSSDAMWCKVDGLFLDTNGKAGEQQVTFHVNADGQSVDDSKANISLRMGQESRVIATIVRTGITNAIVLGNDSVNYTHNQTVTIGAEGTLTLVIKETTFDKNNLYISQSAEWLDIQRDEMVITLNVKPEYLKYSQSNATDSICFSDRETPMMRLHVAYTGMDARTIALEPATQWGLKVAADGQTYKNSLYEMTQEVYDAPIEVTVTALNDAYTLYYANYDKSNGCVLADTAGLWVSIADDMQGGITLSFEENAGGERTGYLFVLPNALCDEVAQGEGVAAFLFEDMDGIPELKAACEQYLIAEFTQESALAGSFHLIDGPTFEYMEVALETDEMYVAFAESNGVSANNVFKAELKFAYPYIFNPMLPLELWDPSIANGTISVINITTGEYAVEGEDYFIEPTMMEAEGDDYMLLQFRSYIESDYIVFFVDAQKVHHKALVVTTKY